MTIDNDCDASAGESVSRRTLLYKGIECTKVLSCNNPQTRRPHSTGTEDYLTGPRVERFQELDNPAHGICRQHRQIHNDLEVIQKKNKGFEGSGYGEVAGSIDAKVFADSGRVGR